MRLGPLPFCLPLFALCLLLLLFVFVVVTLLFIFGWILILTPLPPHCWLDTIVIPMLIYTYTYPCPGCCWLFPFTFTALCRYVGCCCRLFGYALYIAPLLCYVACFALAPCVVDWLLFTVDLLLLLLVIYLLVLAVGSWLRCCLHAFIKRYFAFLCL